MATAVNPDLGKIHKLIAEKQRIKQDLDECESRDDSSDRMRLLQIEQELLGLRGPSPSVGTSEPPDPSLYPWDGTEKCES